jgi:hypothetical protein
MEMSIRERERERERERAKTVPTLAISEKFLKKFARSCNNFMIIPAYQAKSAPVKQKTTGSPKKIQPPLPAHSSPFPFGMALAAARRYRRYPSSGPCARS